MTMQICAVYDLATESYGRPFVVQHTAQAVRSFADECNNPESEFSRYAKDYELWFVGRFDESNGIVQPARERLARALDLVTFKE